MAQKEKISKSRGSGSVPQETARPQDERLKRRTPSQPRKPTAEEEAALLASSFVITAADLRRLGDAVNSREEGEPAGWTVAKSMPVRKKSSTGAKGFSEAAEILSRVRTWAGGEAAALFWYRSQPIAAFGDRTAEALVDSGHATSVRQYLDSIALGGFA